MVAKCIVHGHRHIRLQHSLASNIGESSRDDIAHRQHQFGDVSAQPVHRGIYCHVLRLILTSPIVADSPTCTRRTCSLSHESVIVQPWRVGQQNMQSHHPPALQQRGKFPFPQSVCEEHAVYG